MHSAIPSSTGIGPNDAAEASQPQISSRSRSSPARRACTSASRHAASASAHWLSDPRDERAQAPRPAAAQVVREQIQRGVRGGARPLDARPRVGVEADELPLEPGAASAAASAACSTAASSTRCASSIRPASNSATPSAGRTSARAGSPSAVSATARSSRAAPGRRVAAPQRAPGGARQPLHRLGDERLLAREAELGAVGAGALEVVADDLVLGLGRALQPAGQPLVEVRAAALGQAAVGDLAEQRVGEAEAVVARRALGVDQLAPHERGQRRGQVVVAERRERAAAEAPALDRGVLEQRALVGAELVEPRGQHGLDRRRQLALRPDRHQLLEEQRVAVGALDHPARREPLGAEPRDQGERVDLVERVEAEHGGAALRRRPRGPALQQLRAAEADEQDRRAAGERDQVVDEVQQRRLGPVGVVDHDDERALAAAASNSRRTAQAVSSALAGSSDCPVAASRWRWITSAWSSPASSGSTSPSCPTISASGRYASPSP